MFLTRQCLCIVDTLSRSRLGDSAPEHGEPRRAARRLLLELSLEGLVDVIQSEGADGATHQPRGRCGEHCVEMSVFSRHLVHTLCKQASNVLSQIKHICSGI